MTKEYSIVCQQSFDLQLKDPFPQESFKVYKRRWLILLIYIIYTAINSFQTFEYSIIAHLVMKFYGISSAEVDWMSIIYMALYMPLVIPASYIMDRKGLRFTALIGAIGTALGTTIKVFSISQDHLWLVYFGQFILASMVVFIQPLPTKLASVWFGPDQISLACGLGMFGTFLGQSLGLFLPPLAVQNHENVEEIGREIGYLSYTLAGLSVIIALVVVFYFPKEPPTPPSINQALDRLNRMSRHRVRFWTSLKRLFMDCAFISHIFSYGITVGIFCALTALFNQILITYIPEAESELGQIMMAVSVCGVIGILAFGFILDKSRKFNETTVILAFLMTLSLLICIYGMESRTMIFIYIALSANGLLLNGYMLAGYELTVELTYPEPECTTTGILISICQTSGALMTVLLGYLLEKNTFYGLIALPAICFVCCIVTACLPNRLKRQKYVDIDINQNGVVKF